MRKCSGGPDGTRKLTSAIQCTSTKSQRIESYQVTPTSAHRHGAQNSTSPTKKTTTFCRLLFAAACTLQPACSTPLPGIDTDAITLIVSFENSPLSEQQLRTSLERVARQVESSLGTSIDFTFDHQAETTNPVATVCTLVFQSGAIFIAHGDMGEYATIGRSYTDPCAITLRAPSLTDPDLLELTIAHELGHILGLRHNTREPESIMHSPLQPETAVRFTAYDLSRRTL